MWTAVIAGAAAGLASVPHCTAMCGPLAAYACSGRPGASGQGRYQLGRFLSQPDRGSAVMDRGLWRYSRHPNYFGEFCLWWGIYLIALAGGAWWTIVGPVLLTLFLLKVSGVALTEKDIAERRPEYRKYMRRTSSFFPRPPAGGVPRRAAHRRTCPRRTGAGATRRRSPRGARRPRGRDPAGGRPP